MMFIMMYVDGKTTRETLSILLTEFRAFSESQIALVTHLKYKKYVSSAFRDCDLNNSIQIGRWGTSKINILPLIL